MHKFSDRFINPRFAIMRHAQDIGQGENVMLVERSVDICKQVVRELADKVRGLSVGIRHSPLRRAELTAQVASAELIANGVKVSRVEPCDWLTCDSHGLCNENIQELPDDPQTLWLLITHLPDVENFLGEQCNPANCSLIAKEFLISGNR